MSLSRKTKIGIVIALSITGLVSISGVGFFAYQKVFTTEGDAETNALLQLVRNPEDSEQGADICALMTRSHGVAEITKEHVAQYDYEQSLELANEYLQTNASFKPWNLVAETTGLHRAFQLKDPFGHLVYEFALSPRDDIASAIQRGTLSLNVETGEIYQVNLFYKGGMDDAGRYSRVIASDERVTAEEAFQKAVDLAIANGINVRGSSFELTRSDMGIQNTFRFEWSESKVGFVIRNVQVSIERDGLIRQMIHQTRPISVSLKSTISAGEAQILATRYLTECEEIPAQDIQYSGNELTLESNPRNIKWMPRTLAWIFSFRVDNPELNDERNVCTIHFHLDAHTGEVLFLYFDQVGGVYMYSPCRVY